jgi:hypothetical protein
MTGCGKYFGTSGGNIDARETFKILQMSNKRTALMPFVPFS